MKGVVPGVAVKECSGGGARHEQVRGADDVAREIRRGGGVMRADKQQQQQQHGQHVRAEAAVRQCWIATAGKNARDRRQRARQWRLHGNRFQFHRRSQWVYRSGYYTKPSILQFVSFCPCQ
jgi:hypothetical protein